MIGNESREPAHALTSNLEILSNPNRGGRHDFDAPRIASDRVCPFLHKSHAPVNQSWVGKLQDNAIRHSSRHMQNLRAVAGDPRPRRLFSPCKTRALSIKLHFLP